MNIIYRLATCDDIESIYLIDDKIYKDDNAFILTYEEWLLENKADYINKMRNKIENTDEKVYVATYNKKVVGYIYTDKSKVKSQCHIRSFTMGVDKTVRGVGIGKNLLNKVITWAKKDSTIEKISLGVLSINKPAIELYESQGFSIEGKLLKEYKISNNNYIDDIYMMLLV